MSYKLLTIPQIDVGLTMLDLPLPNSGNCGGYRIPTDNGALFAYSPIDISIAGIGSLYSKEKITDLNKWFIHNTDSIAEIWVTCTCIKISEVYNDLIETYSITGWKGFCKYDINLKNLFKMNAPFTFRNL